jgi:hypothetical protein
LPFLIVSTPQKSCYSVEARRPILQITKYRSSLICIRSIDRLSLMILLPGYNLDCLIYLLSIFVIVISLKVGDLASKLSFDNGYYDLSLVRNM